MAKSLGCSDLNQDCAFRIVAADDESQLIEETTIAHARKHHPDLAQDEPAMREVIRLHIRSLLLQSHTDQSSERNLT
jgi:predicted small metal-binding protein